MNVDAVLNLARAEIRALIPYSSARMEAGRTRVMLNANETPWTSPKDTLDLNRYPEPQPAILRAGFARLYGTAPEQVLIGRGSDEAIDLLVRAFCRAGRDAVVICPPTFGMYAVCAAVQGARVIEIGLDSNFRIDSGRIIAACNGEVKLVFLCSPNNPTGNCIPLSEIACLAAAVSERALLVVDEAYIEFADIPSAIGLLGRHPNIAVLRTLSKAWALAGARVGTLIAHADIVALLRKIMPPYPVPAPSAAAALRALQAPDETVARIETILRERKRLLNALRHLPGVRRILPSAANFVTVFLDDAATAFASLQAAGIVVRDLKRYPGLAGALRITVGTPQENAVLIGALGTAFVKQSVVS
jgi:histidinol-phosphate aminotransferase